MVERSLLWIGGGCKYEQLYRVAVYSDSFTSIYIYGGGLGILFCTEHFLWLANGMISVGCGPCCWGWVAESPFFLASCPRWVLQFSTVIMWCGLPVIHASKATSAAAVTKLICSVLLIEPSHKQELYVSFSDLFMLTVLMIFLLEASLKTARLYLGWRTAAGLCN